MLVDIFRQEVPFYEETDVQQRERKQMAEIFTEAFTGDITEIRMREKELRQQEMMQNAFQEVKIPQNSDDISSPQLT